MDRPLKIYHYFFAASLKGNHTLCVKKYANFEPNLGDDEDIKQLKLTEFKSKITWGPEAMEESLEILVEHAKQANKICNIIRERYENHK